MRTGLRLMGAFFSGLMVLSTTFSDARAQTTPVSTEPNAAALPTPDESMRVFGLVEGWVRAGSVPGEEASLPAVAARVVLRMDAQIVGRGQDDAMDAGSILRATRSAMREAMAFMNLPNDALAEERTREALSRMRLEIELGGTLVPFKPATYAEVDARVRPGIEGVAARFGDREARVFPSAMLVGNDTPGRSLAAAISQASGDATLAMPMTPEGQPGAIAQRHGANYATFRTIHLAQASPVSPAGFLFRSGRVVDPHEISERNLITLGEMIAQHLTRLDPGAGGSTIDGVYWPLLGKSDPDVTSGYDLALSAIALKEFALTIRTMPGLVDSSMNIASVAHHQMIRLSQMGDDAMVDPGTAAAARVGTIMVLSDYYADDTELGSLTDRVLKATRDTYTREQGFSPACTPRCKPMLVFMMAALSTPGSPERDLAKDAVGRLFRETPPEMLVAQMPWLGRAAVIVSDEQVLAAPALRDLRETTWRHQLTPEACGPDGADLVGGIVFARTPVPVPTWQTARPLSFLSTMVRDPRLTDEKERAGELARVLASLRFILQLTMDETGATLALDPSTAMGGVRASLWDQRQPVEASALALISISETLRTLRWMKAASPEARAAEPAGQEPTR